MIRSVRKIILIFIILVILALVFEISRPYRPDNPLDGFVDEIIGRFPDVNENEEEVPVYIEMPSGADLEGLLTVSEERLEYTEGEMILLIPSLGLDLVVQPGTSGALLKKGPGMFEASGLPGQPGANVSIAGHRNRETFYYLDRLKKNDRINLIYDSLNYTYVYYDRSVVLPTEWTVIAQQGFDACTLITCTPIGVADKRMVVRFKLESVTVNDSTDMSD